MSLSSKDKALEMEKTNLNSFDVLFGIPFTFSSLELS